MIHEATFSDDLKVNAIQNDHATIREAVELAIESNCANLVLTHFSQRFAKTAVNQKSKSMSYTPTN
jgi:ribonuclease Z